MLLSYFRHELIQADQTRHELPVPAFNPERMLKGLSLNTLKCFIIAFGDMQELAIKCLLTSPICITLTIKLLHNYDDLPVH